MQVANEKVVSIDYRLTDTSGQLLDTSEGEAPLTYLHGCGNLIAALEQKLQGCEVGQQLSVDLAAAEGYGERNDELVFEVDRESFAEIGAELQTGMQLFMSIEEDAEMEDTVVTVIDIKDDSITVDGNHELAGVDLHFDVTVREIRDATPEELAHGHVHNGDCGHDH